MLSISPTKATCLRIALDAIKATCLRIALDPTARCFMDYCQFACDTPSGEHKNSAVMLFTNSPGASTQITVSCNSSGVYGLELTRPNHGENSKTSAERAFLEKFGYDVSGRNPNVEFISKAVLNGVNYYIYISSESMTSVDAYQVDFKDACSKVHLKIKLGKRFHEVLRKPF
jgi:hypothetical protein